MVSTIFSHAEWWANVFILNIFEPYTLWLFNIAMENDPFIDGLPIENGGSFHGYVSHNQKVFQEDDLKNRRLGFNLFGTERTIRKFAKVRRAGAVRCFGDPMGFRQDESGNPVLQGPIFPILNG